MLRTEQLVLLHPRLHSQPIRNLQNKTMKQSTRFPNGRSHLDSPSLVLYSIVLLSYLLTVHMPIPGIRTAFRQEMVRYREKAERRLGFREPSTIVRRSRRRLLAVCWVLP